MLVITGAGGQLGTHLIARAMLRDLPVRALTSSDWDITHDTTPDGVVAEGDIVINCAAYTAVDAAEEDESRAYAVNAEGAERVARACRDVGARLIHISTDYVFDGEFGDAGPRPYRPGDATAPQGVYARTKVAGELAVHGVLPSAQVVRTAWVYTGVNGDFVGVMRRLAAGEGPVRVVTDQTGSPTYAVDLAEALLDLAASDVQEPFLHAAGGGQVNRFEWAKAVFELVGADASRLQPCLSVDFPRPAPRPAYTALDGDHWADAGLPRLRPWRDALAEALATN
ncbi:dTDP-4-dehydrorhamnose reductase [Mycobacteroides abscessus]|uniref:dTDP-4-dehydrorhamnose reductase n=1 Tax=Mycobacteroides abscessus TaxID=36809 RepID=UPI00078C6204|nr:dTDP-4-dehydrorhamnose reductase [Mycobacteroides abscessus]AMU32158.1 NAD(P)-dependent oxidoreductase [Mycobacteroides abscessus]MDM2492694.1 dTDP-4-dehydrorhamnose reductase [Mycobacteroides abscessus]MDM2512164.1 dTDP-4-dehydrorhamnose reductase [Mycobacteroides abscessus]MDM2521680.1 dTDP-4-dehydrorhamnose reductase [Mycobacteroides abscessus]MDM2525879.1 dTDP-4-dehydrorhamnose reductase [Mycobacteroides abscessus]